MTPNRSMSYRGSEVAAISIAQHMIPKWRGHVELRFAQFMNSPTTPSLSFSTRAPPGPRLKGASMFSVTHFTKSFDRSPTMFACSAGITTCHLEAPSAGSRPYRHSLLNPCLARHPMLDGRGLKGSACRTHAPLTSLGCASFEAAPCFPPRRRTEEDARVHQPAGIEGTLDLDHEPVHLRAPRPLQDLRPDPP